MSRSIRVNRRLVHSYRGRNFLRGRFGLFPRALLRTISLACLLLLPMSAGASSFIPSNPDLQSWLEAGDIASAETYYAGLQQAFESGTASEQVLQQAFRDFDEGSSADGRFYDRWIEAYPKSYAARTARGGYYYRLAWERRGNDFLQQTSPQKVVDMKRLLVQARTDLKASLPLTVKPLISALYLLNAAMLDGSADERRQWLDLGDRVVPDNTLLRLRYMVSLTPKWGGTYPQMHAFLNESRRRQLPETLLARLDALIHTEMARAYRDAKPALSPYVRLGYEQWSAVLALDKTAGEPPSAEALIGYARTAFDLQHRDEADTALRQLEQMPIEDHSILAQMSWIYVKEDRMAEGWTVMKKAAEFDDGWAQFGVAKTLYFGCADVQLKADRKVAREWMLRSASNGNPQAQRFEEIDSWCPPCGWVYLHVN